MKSETERGYRTQIRIGQVTQDSYLFFPRELGDLLLEPGDEVIIVARSSQEYPSDPDFFEKVKSKVTSTEVLDRLKNRETDEWDVLRKAIIEAKTGRPPSQ